MPMSEHYHDSKHRKRKIAFFRRIAPVWYFILIGCPLLIAIAYKIGFRLEPIK